MGKPDLLVAVVDDEEPVRKALRRLFRSAGLDVETFASGRDFLDSLPGHRPDCLVLDLHLPGLTGLDVQRLLAKARDPLPIIVITGKDDPGVGEEVLAAGAAAYLLKPLDAGALLATVTKAVRDRGGPAGAKMVPLDFKETVGSITDANPLTR